LSYVSGEKGKDRSDRETVTPWFKFLWETYRTVLEILRNNSKLEALYAVIFLLMFLYNFLMLYMIHMYLLNVQNYACSYLILPIFYFFFQFQLLYASL